MIPCIFLFVCKSIVLFDLIKEEACVAAVDQVDLIDGDNILHLTYLNSTLATGWSTAGVADSNLTKVFLSQRGLMVSIGEVSRTRE